MIHEYEGSRVTAALIDKNEVKSALSDLGVYPTWEGTPISGSVRLGSVDDTLSVAYDVSGTDARCVAAGTSANSCGIHVHSVAFESCIK